MLPSSFRVERNYVYSSEYGAPKEYFKLIDRLISESGGLGVGQKLVDIGCAAAHFLNYIATRYPDASFEGYDIDPNCLALGRERNPQTYFGQGSVEDVNLMPLESCDICTFFGVHRIFDDQAPILKNLVGWTKPGGRVMIFGAFNPYGVDTLVRFRLADAPPESPYERGCNVISEKTMRRILEGMDEVAKVEYFPFSMPFEIQKDLGDVIRSWTVDLTDGQRILTNGIGLLSHYGVLVATRK